MQNEGTCDAGFTLVEILIVVAIIGLLASIALPNFVKARMSAQKNGCISNLKQINGVKAQWALEIKTNETATPTWLDLVGDTKWLKQQPECPAGGTYTIGVMDAKPLCSLSASPNFHTL